MHLSRPDARIYVAGHRGLVGSAVVRNLEAAGYDDLVVRTRAETDLRDRAAVDALFEEERPDHVVVAAATVGGILANSTRPADFLADNLAIALNVIEAAHESGVGQRGRLLFLGSSCIYPKLAPQPMREEHLLTGPLEPTNRAYAVAKIAGLELAEVFHRQHGDDMVSLMPTNLYGPGDSFDPESSHVLPALIRKAHEARGAGPGGADADLELWGSGTPRREFLHADDLAAAVRFVLETPQDRLREAAPDGLLNAGVGEDLSILELAQTVQDVVGGAGRIVLDPSKPDGTPRKLLDVSRLHGLGWTAETALRDGIAQTYAWYREALADA
ncbi:GDP-L-fucose synthase [Rubrivirga sp. S365]|uniref:GDP-L-fucose synthase n=1 Tax=Rubrivirga litoralis TaxID=3075598 RepID=A0ABU3BRG7_9BACT|nr:MULTISPECIES: GDP-L-fucose synthase [unclassified Rubrivirga]MDT0631868.1 GDP-L-fucose synthase [Rubrivirga sp. F394]MDT7857921.1 GDP-L-fucose synthase [Rubrivirga sp. S365]